MMQTNSFPIIEISGAPFERGYSYGKQCKSRIRDAVIFYRKLFPQSTDELVVAAKVCLGAIQEFAPHLREEIRGISQGAFVSEMDIALLNTRSELLGATCECTSVAFPNKKLLGQTWDWAGRLEKLAIILRVVKEDGNRLLMLVEPGMIGKIGLNSAGIGVCINFLSGLQSVQPGIPFHVLSRLVLETNSLENAVSLAKRLGHNATGHLLVGSSSGAGASIELAGGECRVAISKDPIAHTNHYIQFNGSERGLSFLDSKRRLQRARTLIETTEHTPESLKKIVQDRSSLFFAINKRYFPDFDMGRAGTVAALVMDLDKKRLDIKKGHRVADDFCSIDV